MLTLGPGEWWKYLNGLNGKAAFMDLMVVEDDLVTGTLLKKVLSKEGYTVSHKTKGTDALKAIESGTYRIVLTDWMMPEMDGPTLCRHIRALDLPYYIYIILVTAKDSKKDAVIGLESGADDYIIKPFDNHELKARIRAGRRLVELEDTNRDTQNKLARSEKLAAVGHLAAGVAHEINNPIGFINSNLNTLHGYMHDMSAMIDCYRKLAQTLEQSISQKQLHADLPAMVKQSMALEDQYDIDFIVEDADDLVGDCTGGVERIKAIVHEMRYFAHPETQSIEKHLVDGILKKAVTQVGSLHSQDISIQNNCHHPPAIACNAPHVEQALINMVRNAVEAVDEDGRITIAMDCKDDEVVIGITDTGNGISKENLPKVFDPFFTTKPVGQGVGLGLTTALNIIRMHNGSISAASEEKESTTFTVRLPIQGVE